MSTPKLPHRIALYSFRAFITCILIFYFLYFFELTGASKQQALFTGVFTSGVISIWAGYYYQTTKAPIFRGLSPYKRNQTVIEYSKDAGDYTSSVLGLFVLGIFVIFGLNGMFNA